jgi:hypothetical protein
LETDSIVTLSRRPAIGSNGFPPGSRWCPTGGKRRLTGGLAVMKRCQDLSSEF